MTRESPDLEGRREPTDKEEKRVQQREWHEWNDDPDGTMDPTPAKSDDSGDKGR